METINVNLTPCIEACQQTAAPSNGKGGHYPWCPAWPVLIPLPLEPFRSVTFTVRLGECGRYALCTSDMHVPACSARTIRVSCSISGKTWEESEVFDIDKSGEPFDSNLTYESALAACRERWALVKALVLGKNHDPENDPYEARVLFAQRDAVYAALADMARAEDALYAAHNKALRATGGTELMVPEPHNRPSARALERYVERLIEQVGAL